MTRATLDLQTRRLPEAGQVGGTHIKELPARPENATTAPVGAVPLVSQRHQLAAGARTQRSSADRTAVLPREASTLTIRSDARAVAPADRPQQDRSFPLLINSPPATQRLRQSAHAAWTLHLSASNLSIRARRAAMRDSVLLMARPRLTPDEPLGVLHGLARESHIDVLDAYAEAEHITRAAALRRALEQFVTRPDVRAVAGLSDQRGLPTSA